MSSNKRARLRRWCRVQRKRERKGWHRPGLWVYERIRTYDYTALSTAGPATVKLVAKWQPLFELPKISAKQQKSLEERINEILQRRFRDAYGY